jgi:hypothetical protein
MLTQPSEFCRGKRNSAFTRPIATGSRAKHLATMTKLCPAITDVPIYQKQSHHVLHHVDVVDEISVSEAQRIEE